MPTCGGEFEPPDSQQLDPRRVPASGRAVARPVRVGRQPAAGSGFDPGALGHLTWFATLAGLLVLGLRGSGMRIPLMVALACMALGAWDEWRQLALPGRSFGLDDLLADGAGIVLGVFLACWVQRVRN